MSHPKTSSPCLNHFLRCAGSFMPVINLFGNVVTNVSTLFGMERIYAFIVSKLVSGLFIYIKERSLKLW